MKNILLWVGIAALTFQDWFKNEEPEEHSIGKLYRVNKDVDLLYNKFFKKGVKEIQKTGIITKNTFRPFLTDSSILTSAICKKAHAINPVMIYTNFFDKFAESGTNHYSPSTNHISIGIQTSAYFFAINELKGILDNAKNILSKSKQDTFKAEFMEYKIKGTIHHELAHWLDDTLYGGFLEKTLEKMTVKAKKGKRPTVKNMDIYATNIEIQGTIHNIAQAKRVISQNEWDKLYFDDLISIVPSVSVVYNRLPYSEQKIWLRKLRDRMFREGLLGKNMKYGW